KKEFTNEDKIPLVIALGFIIGIVILYLFSYFNLSIKLQNDIFLSTSATIVATILTVSFSISIFTIQLADQNYNHSLLMKYLKEKATWIIFTLLSVSAIIN